MYKQTLKEHLGTLPRKIEIASDKCRGAGHTARNRKIERNSLEINDSPFNWSIRNDTKYCRNQKGEGTATITVAYYFIHA